jgi:hypothetical protein
MPDTPAWRAHFRQPTGQKSGCGFPVVHGLVLFDAATGRRLDVLISSWRIHDLPRVRELPTGRPLAHDCFLSKVETKLGRRLRPLPVGRPKKELRNRQVSRLSYFPLFFMFARIAIGSGRPKREFPHLEHATATRGGRHVSSW